MRLRNPFPVFCLFMCLTALLGAEEKTGDPAPGHSHFGEAFNEGPRQQAYLMEGTGTIDFPVTTSHEEAQKFFNQGVGQLHGFWDFEAERSFRQVLFLDPDCAMAYWGIAMANNRNEKRAAEIIEEAKPAVETGRLSKREEMYLQSLITYFSDLKKDKKERKRKWVRDLEAIVQAFPEDSEAVAFLVLEIWRNSRAGLKINSHLAVDSLIDRVLTKSPMHPIHHYRIHLWDYENPKVAIPSAARCGQSAPGIAHMWHMPGHTYSKRGRYRDAAWQQEASARVDHAHMMRDRLMPDQISNYAHNNGWLVENLGFLGRVEDGVSLAKNLIELPRLEKLTSVEKDGPKYYNPGQGSYGEGRKRLFKLLVDYERWEELLELTEGPYLTATGDPGEDAKR
ncbi:MAG: alkyl hydroperoxide reductase, partial [Verrucomicrobiota bacterium]